ncbi:putative ketodeoxygluconokinase [Alteromonas mediterranea UM4b]|nr:putative ketodeoxygluconokinase [Alteromonas mediterranea UM4b]
MLFCFSPEADAHFREIIYTDACGERSFTYWRNDSAAKGLMSLLNESDAASLTAMDMVLFSGISLAVLNREDLNKFWRLLEAVDL